MGLGVVFGVLSGLVPLMVLEWSLGWSPRCSWDGCLGGGGPWGCPHGDPWDGAWDVPGKGGREKKGEGEISLGAAQPPALLG